MRSTSTPGWDDVGANLKLGRLRLVFVADKISRELRRIIEFLNAQMTETEVLGVEIRQYVDAGNEHQTLVPRVIGQTEAARDTKTGRGRRPPKRTWDHESWMSVFAEVKPQQTPIVELLLAWAEELGLTIQFGSGAHDPSMQFGYVDETVRFFPFFVHARGGLELPFTLMSTIYPRSSDSSFGASCATASTPSTASRSPKTSSTSAPISRCRRSPPMRRFSASPARWSGPSARPDRQRLAAPDSDNHAPCQPGPETRKAPGERGFQWALRSPVGT